MIVIVVSLLAVLALTASMRAGAGIPPGASATGRPDTAELLREAGVREAGFRFDPAITAPDRQAIADAVASARPEAQRLVAIVDGLTTIRLATLDSHTAGEARPTAEGYELTLDLGTVHSNHGVRGVRRLVLHELGHVVDDALLTDALRSSLDAGIPPGWPCDPGTPQGSCAPVYERFAESFAKWATGDIGVDLYLGYQVPPPALESWGRPLTTLGA